IDELPRNLSVDLRRGDVQQRRLNAIEVHFDTAQLSGQRRLRQVSRDRVGAESKLRGGVGALRGAAARGHAYGDYRARPDVGRASVAPQSGPCGAVV